MSYSPSDYEGPETPDVPTCPCCKQEPEEWVRCECRREICRECATKVIFEPIKPQNHYFLCPECRRVAIRESLDELSREYDLGKIDDDDFVEKLNALVLMAQGVTTERCR